MLADELDYVVGVDTHRDEHVLAVLAAPAGAVVARHALGANARGYRDALRFVEQYTEGARAWAVEGTGHYGAGLARFLTGRGETVLEISRTAHSERRLRQGGRTRRGFYGAGGACQRDARATALRAAA